MFGRPDARDSSHVSASSDASLHATFAGPRAGPSADEQNIWTHFQSTRLPCWRTDRRGRRAIRLTDAPASSATSRGIVIPTPVLVYIRVLFSGIWTLEAATAKKELFRGWCMLVQVKSATVIRGLQHLSCRGCQVPAMSRETSGLLSTLPRTDNSDKGTCWNELSESREAEWHALLNGMDSVCAL